MKLVLILDASKFQPRSGFSMTFGILESVNPLGIGCMDYLSEYDSLGHNAQYKGVLAVGELARPLRTLPVEVVLHQVHVVQGRIVEL
jgi:hypothetical protein